MQIIQRKIHHLLILKKIEPRGFKYENNTKSDDKYLKNKFTTYIDSNNVDEHLPYKSFSTEM